jgi:ankyrin repeat protein
VNDEVLALLRKVNTTPDFGYVTFDSISATNALGDNALHCVCVWNDLAAAKLLVENGINVNQPGEHGFTPLRMAAAFGSSELVSYLLANGADPAGLESAAVFDPKANTIHMQGLDNQLAALENRIGECRDDSNASVDRGREV